MRKMKFRAWNAEENKMLDWEHLRGYCDIDFLFGGAYERGNHPYPYPIAMQYSGLKDKNSKEVYEGDIYLNPLGHKMKIDFSLTEASFVGVSLRTGRELPLLNLNGELQGEIVGNIYENPELLNSVNQ